jgi:signal transduction histidine kinase
MQKSLVETDLCRTNLHVLLAYVADLELEVDRLRKQREFLQQESRETIKHIRLLCQEASGANPLPVLAQIQESVLQLAGVLRDLQEPPGYHPAYDQVIAMAVRPLAEQVFRWQQRLLEAGRVELRFELESEHIEWFPARLRHILDNLISNALKYRDVDKEQAWVCLALQVSPTDYELRISDNGVGLPPEDRAELFELFYRAAPARAAGLGVGLAVAKLLVEKSGGSLTVDSGEGQGTTFVAVLPRYDVDDFLI